MPDPTLRQFIDKCVSVKSAKKVLCGQSIENHFAVVSDFVGRKIAVLDLRRVRISPMVCPNIRPHLAIGQSRRVPELAGPRVNLPEKQMMKLLQVRQVVVSRDRVRHDLREILVRHPPLHIIQSARIGDAERLLERDIDPVFHHRIGHIRNPVWSHRTVDGMK